MSLHIHIYTYTRARKDRTCCCIWHCTALSWTNLHPLCFRWTACGIL